MPLSLASFEAALAAIAEREIHSSGKLDLPRVAIAFSLVAVASLSAEGAAIFFRNLISGLRPKSHRHASYFGYVTLVDEVQMRSGDLARSFNTPAQRMALSSIRPSNSDQRPHGKFDLPGT
jgi:hypothetical protein